MKSTFAWEDSNTSAGHMYIKDYTRELKYIYYRLFVINIQPGINMLRSKRPVPYKEVGNGVVSAND